MAVPAVTINLELNQIEAGEFVVGTSLVGGSDLIGDGLSEVQSAGVRCSIRRGRWGQLFEDFEAASVSVILNNEDRQFDPSHATGDYYGELVPGRDLEITAGGVTIFTGFVQDYDLEFDVSGRSVTMLRATDALGRLAGIEFDAWTNSTPYSTTKLEAICNRPEVGWPAGLRDFIGAHVDIGGPVAPVTLLAGADTVSWGSNVLNYCQLIARSDWLGFLFTSALGVLTLRPVAQFASLDTSIWVPGILRDEFGEPIYDVGGDFVTAPSASFGGINIPYQAITAQYGSERLYAEVSIDTDAIDAQTASVVDTDAWQTTYGPIRRLSIGGLLLTGFTTAPPASLLISTEDFVLGFAEDLLAFYDAPAFRITEFSVELAALSSVDQASVLGTDIADVVSISFTPNGVGAAIEQTLVVQGIAHEITPDSHVVTFSVIDYTV